MTMETEWLIKKIEQLEKELEETKAAKPAHDSTGLHAMRLLEIEDELGEKRKLLQEASGGDETDSTVGGA